MIVGRVSFGNGAMGDVLQFNQRKTEMKKQHILFVILLLTAVYLAGVKYPAPGMKLLSKVGLG